MKELWLLYASAAIVGPGARRAEVESDNSSGVPSGVKMVMTSSLETSTLGTSAEDLDALERCKGSKGRTMKKATSIMLGSKADVISVVLTLSPIVDVRRTYSPAPINPAPPVPLLHAARLSGP